MDRIKQQIRFKRTLSAFALLALVTIIWKLFIIEYALDKFQAMQMLLDQRKDEIQLLQQQLVLSEKLLNRKIDENKQDTPIVYAITPTYWRNVQKAELTRISQTLQLVPNVHWILIEDSDNKTDLVRNLTHECNIMLTHLTAKTPSPQKLKEKDPRWKRHRGVEQRNAGLKWLRSNLSPTNDKGVVYFMDDDNTYDVKLFKELRKVRSVGVWPVGLVGGLNAESPIVDSKTGKVTGFKTGWRSNRPFAIDMAGFAISLQLILEKKDAWFSYRMEKGLQESEFLSYFTTLTDLQPLAENCTKVYVWHTRTENPKIRGTIPGLAV